jgi:hypothetical protein
VQEVEVSLDAVYCTGKNDDGVYIVVMLGPCELLLKHSEGSKELWDAWHENEEWRSPLERELLIEEFDVREFATAFVQAELEEVLELGWWVLGANSIAEVVSSDLNSVDIRDGVTGEVVVSDALNAVAESTVWNVASNVEDTCVQCRIVRSQHEKVY